MTNEYIEVNGSEIHRHGVFAKKEIPRNIVVIEYIGRKVLKDESDKILSNTHNNHKKDPQNHAGTYIFDIDEKWDLDGDIPGNDAKFINHSCEPNCKCEIENGRVLIYSIREIKRGEEITYNYGFELNDKDQYDFMEHPCRCGSQKCVGYILDEDDWPKMKELLANRNNKILKHD